MLSLYIHIPYCLVKCGYCDFHSLPTQKKEIPHETYAKALLSQLQQACLQHGFQGRELVSIFFGGGTPSLMGADLFEAVLKEAKKLFQLSSDIEITTEMNPATAAYDWLSEVHEVGVNRVSIGIQSFQPHLLKFLDRDHTKEDIFTVFDDARRAGFENVSCDLIYSIPSQTTREVEEDVKTALSFSPSHISAYQLIFEPGTPLTRKYESAEAKKLPPKLDDELALEQFRLVAKLMNDAGLPRYEVSNFAQVGFESKHNQHYWKYGEYLGLGSGAVSFVKNHDAAKNFFARRGTITRNVHHYLQGDYEWKDVDEINRDAAMSEFCFLALRTREGIDATAFEACFGKKLNEVFEKQIKKFMQEGLLIANENHFTLSDRGIEVSNYIFQDFLL
ncbi:MAG: hypothetical protein COX62_05675 [Deltaproteobacteria bacterium CG_4_10_14_0_2_um_filter_43_8]|nr:MAG: hypothetical protein COX62_05675 [Deltaproteobacteria bacterium CG_4_10_14_0_2_um_filter_43_8]